MRKELNARELFDRLAGAGEQYDEDWWETIQQAIPEEGRLVGRQEWDSRGPGAGAGTVDVYRFRGLFIAYDDVGTYGPFDTFAEAADAVGLYVKTNATKRIWTDPLMR